MTRKKIVVTGAAGLVGQNLVTLLEGRGDLDIVAIDKHRANSAIFRRLHPDIAFVEADMAVPGDWARAFEGADTVVLNHAQIGALTEEPFIANNVTATGHVLAAAGAAGVPYIVHISSSVLNSAAEDFYVSSKTAQERMVRDGPIPAVVLRPTLMYGWFDRKHLGWLARFMKRSPVFPVPNHGKYIRQPLYVRDFCAIIAACIDTPRPGEVFDISGQEKHAYIDIIRGVKRASGAGAMIVRIPFGLFWWLLKIYGWLDRDPPFTPTQLEALVIPEEFPVIDWPGIFGVRATPMHEALDETFGHPDYSEVVLEF